MAKTDKLLDKMRRNPAGDWTIADIQTLCKALGWDCLPPKGGGSHWKVAAPGVEMILTIPAKRPIKPIYIRKLVEMAKVENDGKEDD
jgi:hypothetical protein